MNYLTSVIIWIVIGIGALTIFRISPLSAAVVFLSGCVLELVFEVAVMVFLYTNDHLPEKLPLRNTIIVREHLSLLSGACALSDVFWQKPGGGSADGKAAVPDRRLDSGNPPGLFPQTASDTEFQSW